MRLRILGTLDILDADPDRRLIAQTKRLALLAYLAVEQPRAPISRDELLAIFWAETDTARGRNALNQSAHFIRRVLGPDAVVAHGGTHLSLNPARWSSDLADFRAALQAGDREAALDFYQGDLLAGVHLSAAPEFERWIDDARRVTRDAAVGAASALVREAKARGDSVAHVRWLQKLAAIDPFETAPLQELATALERQGRTAEALRVRASLQSRLEEIGVADPGADAARLLKRLQTVAAPPAEAEPQPPTETPPLPKRRVGRGVLLALTAVATVVLGATRFVYGNRPAPETDTAEIIAVAPFAVVGDSNTAFLGDAAATLLAARFDEMGIARTIMPQVTGERPSSGRVVEGRVLVSDSVITLVATLREQTTRRIVANARASATPDAIFEAVDRLATDLAAAALPGTTGRVASVASRTTHSVPALRAYIEGEQLRQTGRYSAAARAFHNATRLDPDFALAHYRLAIVSDWSNDGQWTRGATDAALRNADRLTPRYRGLVEAVRHYMDRDLIRAEQDLLRLVRDYPDEPEAWYLLGEVRFHYGPLSGRALTDAEEAFATVIRLEPTHAEALLHLARMRALAADERRYREIAARIRALEGAQERHLELDAIEAFAFGSRRAQEQLVASLRNRSAIEVDVASKSVALYARSRDGAFAIARALTTGRTEGWRTRGLAWQSQLLAAQGQWDDAFVLLDSVAVIAPAFAWQMRAVLATAPSVSRAVTLRVRDSLAADEPARAPVPSEIDLQTLGVARRHYLRALLSAKLFDSLGADASVTALQNLVATDLIAMREYQRSADASAAYARRDWSRVASLLAPGEFDARGPTGNALHIGRAPERLMRLRALECLGRADDAREWSASFPEPAGYDLAFVAEARTITSQPGCAR